MKKSLLVASLLAGMSFAKDKPKPNVLQTIPGCTFEVKKGEQIAELILWQDVPVFNISEEKKIFVPAKTIQKRCNQWMKHPDPLPPMDKLLPLLSTPETHDGKTL